MLLIHIRRPVLIFTATVFLLLVGQGLAAAKIECLSCHDRGAFTDKVTHAPVSVGACLACHNPHVAKYANLLQEKVKDLCYSCHTEEAEKHRHGVVVHNPVKQGECLKCHDPHASDQSGLLRGTPSGICFNCHTGFPKKFKYTHIPYAKGQCSSCHRPHQSPNANLLVKDVEELCWNCHQRSAVEAKHPNFPAKLGKCTTCHSPHGSDRPHLVRNILHPPYEESCDNCHNGKGNSVPRETCFECHPDVSEQMASSHNHLVRYRENGCMACHSPHASDDERLLKGKERHVCGKCHEETFRRWDASKHSHQKTDACNNCHAPHGSNHPNMFKGEIRDVCSTCHERHGQFTHPIGDRVFDPRTGQKLTCTSCHATKGSDFPYHTRDDNKKALCVRCHVANA